MTKIASLGCDRTWTGSARTRARRTASSCSYRTSSRRRPRQRQYHILVGSGDREKPLGFRSALDAENYFFMVKDVPATRTG